MPPIFAHLARLGLARGFVLGAIAQALLGAALCFVPLANLLAYEFALLVGLLTAVTALVVGLEAAKTRRAPLRQLLRAWALATAQLVLPLALISLNALRVRNCDYLEGLAFFLLLPGAGALYGATLGVVIGRLLPTRGAMRFGLAIVVALGHLGLTLYRLYSEPPIFAYDHLWGHFAGSLYDEIVRIGPALLAFRLGTIVRVGLLATFLAFLDRERAPLRRASVAALLLFVAFGYDAVIGHASGYRTTHADLERAMPLRIERPGLVVHLPAATSPERAAAIADDHAFRLATLEARLGVHLERPVESYVYASAAEKGRLIGARTTVITKPWLGEIHLHDALIADPVLAHEMVHVVAAAFGSGPLAISARYGVLPNVGLLEGLAEALSPPQGELDGDAFAHTLRALHMAPDLRTLFGTRFWEAAPARAYTLAGSFVRYLLERFGVEPFERAYRAGRLDAGYDASPEALIADWERTIDALPTSAREQRITEQRFRHPSIFVRPCAHEVAALRDEAAHTPAMLAPPLYDAISRTLGRPPRAELDYVASLQRAGDDAAYRRAAEALLERPDRLTTAERHGLQSGLAMLAWSAGDLGTARTAFDAILAEPTSDDEARLAWVRRWGLDEPSTLSSTLRRFTAGDLAAIAAVVAFTEAAITHPERKPYAYLVARQLHRVEDFEAARAMLERAAPLAFAPLELERLRLVADADFRLGRYAEAAQAYERYAGAAELSGDRARARDWMVRLAWLERRAQRKEEAP